MRISRLNYERLELFKKFLDRFQNLNEDSLGLFINKLENYIDVIGEIAEEESDNLRNYWWDCELLYSIYLSEERKLLTDKEIKELTIVNEELRKFVNTLLRKYDCEPEDPYAWSFEDYR